MESPDGDIVLTIKFDPTGSPARVFAIASELVAAFESFDRTILRSVDSGIETTFILEDVQRSSLKVVLKNLLTMADDDAIKSLDWKPIVGNFLLRAKYAALRWCDQDPEVGGAPSLSDLTEEVERLARETDVRHLPDYAPVNRSRMTQSLEGFQRAKRHFRSNEQLTVTLGRDEYEVQTNRTWSPSEFEEIVGEQELENEVDLVLVIRKVDFLGKSKWHFKHGKRTIEVHVRDVEWLDEFHGGMYALKPGDALKVRVRFIYKYGSNGELLDEDVEILKVFSVVSALPGQAKML